MAPDKLCGDAAWTSTRRLADATDLLSDDGLLDGHGVPDPAKATANGLGSLAAHPAGYLGSFLTATPTQGRSESLGCSSVRGRCQHRPI